MAEPIFADGIHYSLPRENAPTWVKGTLSFKVEDVKKFLDAHVNNAGFVNVDIKVSKGGKIYCALNTYVPQKPDMETKSMTVSANDEVDGIPF